MPDSTAGLWFWARSSEIEHLTRSTISAGLNTRLYSAVELAWLIFLSARIVHDAYCERRAMTTAAECWTSILKEDPRKTTEPRKRLSKIILPEELSQVLNMPTTFTSKSYARDLTHLSGNLATDGGDDSGGLA